MREWLLVLTLLGLSPVAVYGQFPEGQLRPPHVSANGEAVIAMEPDQAEIDIGVVTQAKNAAEAARENADKASKITAEVKKLLAKEDEIRTAGYSLNPTYRYPQGGKPEIVGYTASNILRIKTGRLTNVSKLIDGAMQAGANTINRLAFSLKDEHGAQLQALRVASSKAKAKAEEMASALGLKIVRVLAVTEGERGVRPIVMPQLRGVQMEAAASAPTPVEAGTIEVRSSVTLTAEVGAR